MPNANRRAGDYLERQTKHALEHLGYVVIRAAGSLGPADLAALKTGTTTPFLIACKTNGKIGPAERQAVLTAAAQAGARAVIAYRKTRGHIELAFIHQGPETTHIVTLKTGATKP